MKEYLYRAGIVIGVFAVFFLLTGNYLPAFKKPVNLYGEDTDFFAISETDRVNAKFDFTLGEFAELEYRQQGTQNKYTGRTYFIVPVYSNEKTYWIGMAASISDTEIMRQVAEESIAYVMGERATWGDTYLEIEGTISGMPKELEQYFFEWFREQEFDEVDIEERAIPVCFDKYYTNSKRKTFCFTLIGLFLGVISIVVCVMDLKEKADWKRIRKAGSKSDMGQYDPAQYDPAQVVEINGAVFPKEYFATVNSYVQQNDTEQAVKALQSLFKIGKKTAQAIVGSWSVYYQ